jgi:hypothetical protein
MDELFIPVKKGARNIFLFVNNRLLVICFTHLQEFPVAYFSIS